MSDSIWEGSKEWRARSKEKKRHSLDLMIDRYELEDRSEFTHNDGVLTVDKKYQYFILKKQAKVKGNPKKYQMRGFRHFAKVFLKMNHRD
jgi:hypothetical protein